MSAHPARMPIGDGTGVGGGPCLTLVDPLELPVPPRSRLVWHRTLELAETFEQHHLFTAVLEILRTARHDLATLEHALALGHARLDDHPRDLVAWRATGLLGRSVTFLGGPGRAGYS